MSTVQADDTSSSATGGENTGLAGVVDAGGVVGLRPPPPGLSRRDRRQWRSLEVARLERNTVAAARATSTARSGWQQGFIHPPPRGLGRAGRRAWLGTERAAAREFWRTRRASDIDIADRSTGVMVVAILLGIAVLVGVLTRSPADPAPARTAVAPATLLPNTAASTSTSPPPATTPTTAAAAAAGDHGDGPAAAEHVAGLPSVAGRWQPAPITGVAAQTVVAAPTVDPGSVVLQEVPAGPVTAADQVDPVTAVTAWLVRTCGSSWTDPFASDQLRGQPLMTTAGWTATDPRDDAAAAAVWAGVVAARQTRVCGDLQVQTSAGIPAAAGYALVGYTAHRIVTSPDTAPVVEDLSGTRLVRQATTDGRWFVDVPAIGG